MRLINKVRDKITFHVISHTHWDREWYLPFEVFRIELVELIDRLLDILEENKIFIFHLDGQTIILQDYLEIKPHKKDQIKKFVNSGNLLIGPWYVLSDQFLTSGEATIRNLLYGMRDAKEFGNVMSVGYLPDQFGQIAQLPQIFKGFNINSAVVGRGIQDSISEHNWYGLNGDCIVAIALTHWYNNAQRFPSEKEKLQKYLDKIFETQSKTSHSGHILLMNGCDHLFPQSNLIDILKSIESNGKWQIVHDGLPEAIDFIKENPHKENYPIYFSELRDDNNKYILSGTLSSRVYLKLENYKCQTKLEKVIEPLSILLALTTHHSSLITYPHDLIKYAWKLLMQNHAHDSICGCSIDDVHKEMEVRFLKVDQVLNKLKENLLSFPNTHDKSYIQLINLTNYHRQDVIEADLEFPLGPIAEHPSATPTVNKEEIKNLTLTHNGKVVDCEIIENLKTFKMVRSNDEVPLLQAIQKIKILFQANIEPFSIKSYEVEEKRNGETARRRNGDLHEFESKEYKLKINNDGTISIFLKDKKYAFENIHYLSIEDDLGDEYNFGPNPETKPIFSSEHIWSVKVIEENGFRKKFLLSPKGISDLELTVEITCYKDSNRIDFKTKINNHFKNKRIRLHFPTALNTNYLSADTPFGVLQRSRPPVDWVNYASSQPLHNWIDHSNDNFGFAFFGHGLADYELYEDGNGFAVTLIRAISRLSKVKSHSLIQTPEAQCNREINFFYAIYPHTGNWQSAKICNEELVFQTPLVTNQSNLALNIDSLFTFNKDLVISSLKRSEDKENIYILRLFNPYNKIIENCNLNLNFPFKKISLVNLNEEKISEYGFKKTIDLEVKPYQILTFGIEA